MSDGCALCRRLPSGHCCYQDFLSFATGSSLVGTVGAAGAGLLPFDQGEPAEAVGSVLWLSFALPSSRTLQLLRHLCLISLGGADLFPSASGSLRNMGQSLVSPASSHVRHPNPPPRLFSVGVADLRPLQAQLRRARVLLCVRAYHQRLLCHTYLQLCSRWLVLPTVCE